MKYPNKNRSRGFTLIELLVVISIIALLSSVVLGSLNSARVKARDARRKLDLETLTTAINMYYNDNGSWPDDEDTSNGDWGATLKTQLAPYLKTLPIDPTVNTAARYYAAYHMSWSSDSSCNNHYVVWGYLEGPRPVGTVTCNFNSGEYFKIIGSY